jgi:nucleotide-binding universal stress UspA family protein
MAIGFPEAEYNTSQAEFAADVLERVRALAETHALSVVTLHGKDSYPADGIVDTAKTHGCDLIVMASHGRRGVSRLLLGSEANQVVTRSSVPVLIVR